MSEKPILFNEEMTRAILDGNKTQTRRKIKPNHINCDHPVYKTELEFTNLGDCWYCDICGNEIKASYKAGDILYINNIGEEVSKILLKVTSVRVERLKHISEADCVKEGFKGIKCDCKYSLGWFCHDCHNTGYIHPPSREFQFLWDCTVKKQGLDVYGWDANPYVWVIEFERVLN